MVLVVKNPSANAGDIRCGFNPWIRKIPWRRAWYPLEYSYLKNPVDRGGWRATVHRVTKSWTRLKWLSRHTHSTQWNNTQVFWEWMIHIWFEKSGKASTWSISWKKISERQRRNGKGLPRRKQYEISFWLCAYGAVYHWFTCGKHSQYLWKWTHCLQHWSEVKLSWLSDFTTYLTMMKNYSQFGGDYLGVSWCRTWTNIFPQYTALQSTCVCIFLGPNVTFSKLLVVTQVLLSDDLVPAEFFCLSC